MSDLIYPTQLHVVDEGTYFTLNTLIKHMCVCIMSIKCQSYLGNIDLFPPSLEQYDELTNHLHSQWQLISTLFIREKYGQATPANKLTCNSKTSMLQISFLITALRLSLSPYQKRLLA